MRTLDDSWVMISMKPDSSALQLCIGSPQFDQKYWEFDEEERNRVKEHSSVSKHVADPLHPGRLGWHKHEHYHTREHEHARNKGDTSRDRTTARILTTACASALRAASLRPGSRGVSTLTNLP